MNLFEKGVNIENRHMFLGSWAVIAPDFNRKLFRGLYTRLLLKFSERKNLQNILIKTIYAFQSRAKVMYIYIYIFFVVFTLW